jgi:hypothetical protein
MDWGIFENNTVTAGIETIRNCCANAGSAAGSPTGKAGTQIFQNVQIDSGKQSDNGQGGWFLNQNVGNDYEVTDNIIAHQTRSNAGFAAIQLSNYNNNVKVERNVVYKWGMPLANFALSAIGVEGTFSNISIADNIFDQNCTVAGGCGIYWGSTGISSELHFARNRYHYGTNGDKMYLNMDFPAWSARSGDPSSGANASVYSSTPIFYPTPRLFLASVWRLPTAGHLLAVFTLVISGKCDLH